MTCDDAMLASLATAGRPARPAGCMLRTKKQYVYGTVSTLIQLVPGNSAGTVTTYYVSTRVVVYLIYYVICILINIYIYIFYVYLISLYIYIY